jgi:hypothetical protein
MKQEVHFTETDDMAIIQLVDSEEYVFTKELEPDEKNVEVGLTKKGLMNIKSIKYPKTIYDPMVVRETADKIRARFEQEGCKPCIAMHEANETRKSFVVVTPKDLLDEFFASVERNQE